MFVLLFPFLENSLRAQNMLVSFLFLLKQCGYGKVCNEKTGMWLLRLFITLQILSGKLEAAT